MKHLFRMLAAASLLLVSCSPDSPGGPAAAPARPAEAAEAAAAEAVPEPPATIAAPDPDVAALPTRPVPKGLPFLGRRTFETRPAVTGTGTPHRYLEILENGDVYFAYGQQDAHTGSTMSGERVYAGKFGKVMKCEFKELEGTRYYVVTRRSIVEVDENGRRLSSADCCPNEKVDLVTQCPCEGELFQPAP